MKSAAKNSILMCSIVFAALAGPRPASAQTADEAPPQFRDINLPIHAFEAPADATADAEAKILIGGYFPSNCYRDARATVESPDPHTHFVRGLASKVINRFCTQSIQTYERQVSLGALDPGEHTLIVQAAHGDVLVGRFTVSSR